MEEAKSTIQKNIQETEADDFSANILLREEEYQQIIDELNSGNDIFKTINKYALIFFTHPDIIIGRILFKNNDFYKYGFLQKEINRVDFKELIS